MLIHLQLFAHMNLTSILYTIPFKPDTGPNPVFPENLNLDLNPKNVAGLRIRAHFWCLYHKYVLNCGTDKFRLFDRLLVFILYVLVFCLFVYYNYFIILFCFVSNRF